MQSFFSDTHVTVINVSPNSLHLKSNITVIAQDKFVLAENDSQIAKQIELKSKFGKRYTFVNVSNEKASNVLVFNNFLLYPKSDESEFQSMDELLNGVKKIGMDNSEFFKLDGCLTCRCVLFSSKRNQIEN